MFDFDGVIVDSNQIRLQGFIELYKFQYPKEMEKFSNYLKDMHGISRYQKIRFFFEDIINKKISDSKVIIEAEKYSQIVKEKIVLCSEIVGAQETLSFLDSKENFNLAIISSSDQNELREICKIRKLDRFFSKIYGSPTNKSENIKKFISQNAADQNFYIGDSIHDRLASEENKVNFIGFNLDSKNEFLSVKNYKELKELFQ